MLSQTFFKNDRRIHVYSRLILLLKSSMESTEVVHTFSFKFTHRKSHKELNQVKAKPLLNIFQIGICSRVASLVLYLDEHYFIIVDAHLRCFDRELVAFHYLLCVPYFRLVGIVHERRTVLRGGWFSCIFVWNHLFFRVIDSVLMYSATVRAFPASLNAILLIFFRVKNLDVMRVRSRLCRISVVCKEALYDYYMNQQARTIIFYTMTSLTYGPFRKTVENAFSYFTRSNLFNIGPLFWNSSHKNLSCLSNHRALKLNALWWVANCRLLYFSFIFLRHPLRYLNRRDFSLEGVFTFGVLGNH